MVLFRKARSSGTTPEPTGRTPESPGPAPASASASAPGGLWADGFGRLAIRAVQIIVVVIVAGAIIFAIQSLTLVTIPLVLALILSCGFWPVMRGMRRRGMPPVMATIATLVAIVVLIGGVGWLIVWAVRNQWDDLYAQAQDGFQAVLTWVKSLSFVDHDQLDAWAAQLEGFVTSAQFGTGALAGVSIVANFVTGAVLMVVVLFFFLKDGPTLWEFVLRPFHGASYVRARRIGEKTVTIFGSYLRGTATVAFADAVGILIGLLILQVPLALPLAVLVFVLAFIPIVGATLAGILAALVALVSNGVVNALFVVGVVVLVNQLEGNFLQPFVMGRSMRLHALVILIALAVGTVLGGIVGAILAVPITAAAWGVIQVWDGPDLPAPWARVKPGTDPPAEPLGLEPR